VLFLILSHAVEVRVALDQTSFGQFRYACWLSGSFSPAWDGPQPNGAPQHRYDWGRLRFEVHALRQSRVTPVNQK
jgi:hypothetical protein